MATPKGEENSPSSSPIIDDASPTPTGAANSAKDTSNMRDGHHNQNGNKHDDGDEKKKKPPSSYSHTWITPPWLRWDPDADHELTWGLNILFGASAAFSVANLYYNHPILHVLATDFHVTNERASLVPTITQAGYALGLLLVVPIGDLVRRRPFILSLVLATALLWLGCTLTPSNNFTAFLILSFFVGLLTVTPQLMFPLTVQYAAAGRRRATMISVVMSGVVFGMLVARLLSGVLAQYVGWRYVYWVAFALQMIMWLLLFVFMPDYPVLQQQQQNSSSSSTNPGAFSAFISSYLRNLHRMILLPIRSPLLTQQCLIAFLNMGVFTSFWTTLTFQLSGIFHLSTLAVGLFALVGLAPVFLNPILSRLLIARAHPSGSLLVGLAVALASVCVGTFVGTFSLAGPVLWAFFGDLAMNVVVVANRVRIANVAPEAQNAVNADYMVFTFCGQIFGTAMGNALYASGGWTHSGALNIAQTSLAILLVVARGPHEKGWLGWRGGWDLRISQEKPVQSDGEAGRSNESSEGATANPENEKREV